jgi:hypothetical protein
MDSINQPWTVQVQIAEFQVTIKNEQTTKVKIIIDETCEIDIIHVIDLAGLCDYNIYVYTGSQLLN